VGMFQLSSARQNLCSVLQLSVRNLTSCIVLDADYLLSFDNLLQLQHNFCIIYKNKDEAEYILILGTQ
jgi:hypothetical protein